MFKMKNIRVNVLTPLPFWHPGSYELSDGLKNEGIEVVALDIWSFRYFDKTGKLHNLIPWFITGPLVRVYRKLFRKSIIRKYIKKGDIVDIQWCGHYYSEYIDFIKRREVKILATLFGSDFYRSSQEELHIQRKIYETADIVVIGPNMKPDFDKQFPGFSNKTIFNQFGSKRLDIIAEIAQQNNKHSLRKKYGIPDQKIVVTVGYNAKPEQQHLIFLKQIKSLDTNYKNKLFILLPLTYGKEDVVYNDKLTKSLSELNIEYKCIENRLTDDELAETKIISDITVNLQTTDALSSSIKEAFVAGDILLVGDWLPYSIYKNLGAYFVTASLYEFKNKIIDIIDSFDSYKNECRNNTEIILKFASWKYILPEFIRIYKELHNGGN
jgi:glycosyltransferase involved in cell wall biosynthesis